MGHVKAPRSKGCRVCVQRRIKCDQTRPFCQRCLRANRPCTGFEVQFVDEGPALRGFFEGSGNEQSAGRASSSSSSSPSLPELEQPGVSIRNPTTMAKARKGKKPLPPSHGDSWHQGAFETVALMSLLTPDVFQDQLVSHVFHSTLPLSASASYPRDVFEEVLKADSDAIQLANFIASIRQPVLGGTVLWLAELALRPTLSVALTWAIRAISTSQLARKAGDGRLIDTSRQMYGKALLKLSSALLDSEEGLSSDTLSATVLLSFYEIFNCTDRYSWIKHAGGAAQLIKIRGPERHRSGVGRLVFTACRVSIIMDSFQKQVPCFLDEPSWRKLCWDIRGDAELWKPLWRTDEEYFQEVASLPAYLEKAVRIVSDPNGNTGELQDLLAEGLAHRSKLRSIKFRMGEEMAEVGNEPIQVPSSLNDETFPVVYDYPDVYIASLHCGYWAIMCFTNISIVGIESRMAGLYECDSPPQRGALSTWGAEPISGGALGPQIMRSPVWDAAKHWGDTHRYISENAYYAREICKSAEYMSRGSFLGPLPLIFALRMALRMKITEEEKAWIVRKLGMIGRNMGLAVVEIERYKGQRKGKYLIEWEQKTSPGGEGMVDRELNKSPSGDNSLLSAGAGPL